MPILWIMVLVLAITVPLLVSVLKGVVGAARSIEHHVDAIAGVAAAGSKDLDAVVVLLTTQSYISQVVDGLANYGGSLDAALPEA